jgi:hypothetical protein
MSVAEVQAELRQVTGKPWKDDADAARRQALWQRLDKLVAKDGWNRIPHPRSRRRQQKGVCAQSRPTFMI